MGGEVKNNISNVTVNGLPVGEYIAKTQAKKFRKKTFTNGLTAAKSSQGAVIYEAGQKAQKVRVCGEVFAWKDKAPYVKSGMSILGGVEMSRDEKQVRCHECGEWRTRVDMHVRAHGLTPRQYRIKHGLNLRSSLNSTDFLVLTRERLKKYSHPSPFKHTPGVTPQSLAIRASVKTERLQSSGKVRPEAANLRMACEAQRIAELRTYAVKLSRTPTIEELNNYVANDGSKPLRIVTLKRLFGTKFNSILLRAGLKPRKGGASVHRSRSEISKQMWAERRASHATGM